jgi:hypothetical protein
MKAIFSYWNCNNSRFFCNLEMAKVANDSAQKSGYKTCLYTDVQGYENLGLKIPYDEIILFDDNILSQFYPKIWSLGKILAMSLAQEPFIHLDFDFFLFKKLDDEIAQRDFFSLYDEPWLNKNIGVQNDVRKIFSLSPDKELRNKLKTQEIKSYNFSIVGGQKFIEIGSVCEQILNFARVAQKNLIRLDNNGFNSPNWILPVTFEQILIPLLLKINFNIDNEIIIPIPQHVNLNINVDVNDILSFNPDLLDYLKEGFIKHKFIHLHGNKEIKFEEIKEKIFQKIY